MRYKGARIGKTTRHYKFTFFYIQFTSFHHAELKQETILVPSLLAENGNFRPNYFEPKLAKMKILLCKWHMAINNYFKNLFDLILKFCTLFYCLSSRIRGFVNLFLSIGMNKE